MFEVLSKVDGRHATLAEVAFELVAISEGGREPGGDFGHGELRYGLRTTGASSLNSVAVGEGGFQALKGVGQD